MSLKKWRFEIFHRAKVSTFTMSTSKHTCAEEHIASVVQLPQDGELLGLTVTSTGFNDMISIGTSKTLATV